MSFNTNATLLIVLILGFTLFTTPAIELFKNKKSNTIDVHEIAANMTDVD